MNSPRVSFAVRAKKASHGRTISCAHQRANADTRLVPSRVISTQPVRVLRAAERCSAPGFPGAGRDLARSGSRADFRRRSAPSLGSDWSSADNAATACRDTSTRARSAKGVQGCSTPARAAHTERKPSVRAGDGDHGSPRRSPDAERQGFSSGAARSLRKRARNDDHQGHGREHHGALDTHHSSLSR